MLAFAEAFAFWSAAVFLLLAAPLKLLPWTRRRLERRVYAAVLLAAAAAGWLQGRATVTAQTEASLHALSDRPKSGTTMRLLVGDQLPALRRIGGTITPAMRREAERIAESGPPCPAALAARFLGRKADAAACRTPPAR